MKLAAVSEFFQCPICMCDMSDTHITSCGHRFCFPCIAESVDRNHCCPCCRSPLQREHLIKDTQFQELIATFCREKESAEKEYFDRLIESQELFSQPACGKNCCNTCTEMQDKKRDRLAEKLHNPMEAALVKRFRESLSMHYNYSRGVQNSFKKRIKQANEQHEKRLARIEEQQVSQEEKISLSDVERIHAQMQLNALESEMRDIANKTAQAYDRYLVDHLPDPYVLPISISVCLLSKDKLLKDVVIEPEHSVVDIINTIKTHTDNLNDVIVSMDEDIRLIYFYPGYIMSSAEASNICHNIVNNGASHQYIYELPGKKTTYATTRPLLELGLRSGGQICVYGDVKCKSDLPKQCFVSTYIPNEGQTVDYFTCKTCSINWVCRSCVEVCHTSHSTAPYILNHQPTWSCCYCPKKKKCCIVQEKA